MFGDVVENAGEGSDFDGIVIRNGKVVLPALHRG